jgi:branched-chain amino acid transport system permease protein
MRTLAQQIVNGLSLGCLYGLIAIGYSMVFGVLRLVNFAHAQLFMLGPVFVVLLLGAMGITEGPFRQMVALSGLQRALVFLMSMLAAALVALIVGLIVERVIYRQFRGQRGQMLMLSSLAASIVLQNTVMLFVGSRMMPFAPILPLRYFSVAGVAFTSSQVLMLVVFIVLMVGLSYIMNRTYLGLCMKASAEDLDMASLCGIDTTRVIQWVFILGPALGGIAGLLFSMHYSQAFYFMGSQIGGKGWVVAILGGIGNITGAAVAGLFLGVLESLGAGYLPLLTRGVLGAEYKHVLSFIMLIIVLLFKPEGLFSEATSRK